MTYKRRQSKANFKNFFKVIKKPAATLAAGEIAPRKKPRRGIYILPNAFTTAALFCGFYAIVMGMDAHFDKAVFAIFIAMVLDSLDGRVARLTNTQSEFGAQYDSLSDMVSFGVAPALVAYEWGLRGLGQWGWLAAFVYCACAALRLARFNTNIAVVDKRYFQGIPSPAAAGLVAGFIWALTDFKIDSTDLRWVIWAITLVSGFTMVSNIPFYSFKEINLKKSVPFAVPLVFVLAYVLIVSYPSIVLFTVFVLYCISGYAIFLWRWRKGRPVSIVQTKVEVHDHEHEHDHD
ncbi:CDP-diacylglycerol--serine O-phosphatidyltransferase [Oxalobacteraceae bacterium GrIS 2.11]